MEDEVFEEDVQVSDEAENQVDNETEDLNDEVVDEWQPDYSYDVKGEKREFDERFRSVINSKDDEDALRDLYTKADGLDAIKEKADKYKNDYDEAFGQIELMSKGFSTLKEIRDTKNIDKLIDALGASDDEVFQDAILEWAIKKADFLTLPQEEQERISGANSQQKELSSLRSQVQQLQSQGSANHYQSEMNRMRSMISSEWSDLNSKLSEVGINFEDEVLMNGTNQFKTTGVEPTIEDAIKITAAKYGFINNNKTPMQQQMTEKKPGSQTLPRVRRTASSSVNEVPRSIDDLKKLAASMGI